MTNDRHPGKYKVGFSTKVKLRRFMIEKSMAGKVNVVFSIYLWTAYPTEQTLHWVFGKIRTRLKGSGGTEWFEPGEGFVLPLLFALAFWWFDLFQYVHPYYKHATVQQAFVGGIVVVWVLQVAMFPAVVWVLLAFVRLVELLAIPAAIFIYLWYSTKTA